MSELEGEIKRLEGEKPKYLNELEAGLAKRYVRLSKALQGLAVTTVVAGDSCGGCGTRIPPQVVVEVRKNEQIVTCEACGRILVFYS